MDTCKLCCNIYCQAYGSGENKTRGVIKTVGLLLTQKVTLDGKLCHAPSKQGSIQAMRLTFSPVEQ